MRGLYRRPALGRSISGRLTSVDEGTVAGTGPSLKTDNPSVRPENHLGLSADVLSVFAGFGVARTGVEGLACGRLLAARETVRLAGPDNGLGAAGSGFGW